MTLDLSAWLQQAKQWARAVKRDVIALWLAARDARVSWPAKLLAAGVAAYALSPIDLIPHFIPVLGYLDDLILVPLGIMLAVHLVPPPLMIEFRAAAAVRAQRPVPRGRSYDHHSLDGSRRRRLDDMEAIGRSGHRRGR